MFYCDPTTHPTYQPFIKWFALNKTFNPHSPKGPIHSSSYVRPRIKPQYLQKLCYIPSSSYVKHCLETDAIAPINSHTNPAVHSQIPITTNQPDQWPTLLQFDAKQCGVWRRKKTHLLHTILVGLSVYYVNSMGSKPTVYLILFSHS